MLRTPGKTVVILPLLFECIAVACPGPEFGLFHVDGIYAGINHPFYMLLLEVGKEIIRWYDVRHKMTMPYRITILCHLSFIEMPFSVPFAGKIILVFTPGNAGHKMGFITPILPSFYTLLNRYTG